MAPISLSFGKCLSIDASAAVQVVQFVRIACQVVVLGPRRQDELPVAATQREQGGPAVVEIIQLA